MPGRRRIVSQLGSKAGITYSTNVFHASGCWPAAKTHNRQVALHCRRTNWRVERVKDSVVSVSFAASISSNRLAAEGRDPNFVKVTGVTIDHEGMSHQWSRLRYGQRAVVCNGDGSIWQIDLSAFLIALNGCSRGRRKDYHCRNHIRFELVSTITRTAMLTFGSRIGGAALLVLATVLAYPVPAVAQLRVIISGGFSAAYKELVPEFERTSGISLVTASGSSQGDGPTTIGAQLRSGALFDVVILNTTGLAALMAQGRIVKGSERRLAQVLTGIGVRVGSAAPDVGTADALRQTLRLAKIIATSASSANGVAALLTRLGIGDEVTVKVGARYSDANSMVERGEAALSIQPVSEILNMPGAQLGGTIPSNVRPAGLFVGAIFAGSTRLDEAGRLVAFLASDAARGAIERAGMEQPR